MNELISIENKLIGTETNSVNAKELHKFIQAKVRFNDWITRRIEKYGFIENEDYIIIKIKTMGRPLKEYHITLDMAKELAMVENNDKGREARRYFIDCEKRALKPKPTKDNIDIQNINDRLKLLESIVANNLTNISKNTNSQNTNIIVNSEKVQDLQNAKTIFKVSKPNKNNNLKEKNKFYKDILEVIANYPEGASQRTLLRDAGYSQSKKIRRWLQEKISILWDMTIIPGKCYKYVLKNKI